VELGREGVWKEGVKDGKVEGRGGRFERGEEVEGH